MNETNGMNFGGSAPDLNQLYNQPPIYPQVNNSDVIPSYNPDVVPYNSQVPNSYPQVPNSYSQKYNQLPQDNRQLHQFVPPNNAYNQMPSSPFIPYSSSSSQNVLPLNPSVVPFIPQIPNSFSYPQVPNSPMPINSPIVTTSQTHPQINFQPWNSTNSLKEQFNENDFVNDENFEMFSLNEDDKDNNNVPKIKVNSNGSSMPRTLGVSHKKRRIIQKTFIAAWQAGLTGLKRGDDCRSDRRLFVWQKYCSSRFGICTLASERKRCARHCTIDH